MQEPIEDAILVILEDIWQPSETYAGANCADELQLAITLNPDLNKIVLAIKQYGKQLLKKAAENASVEILEHHIAAVDK